MLPAIETETNISFILPWDSKEAKLPLPVNREGVILFELSRWNKYRQAVDSKKPIILPEQLTEEQKTLLCDVRMAVAASNSLTFSLEEGAIETRNLMENSHHLHFHDRRVDKWGWTLVYNTPELFGEKSDWGEGIISDSRYLVYSLSLFSRWHDFIQNEYSRLGMKESRKGHQSGAALLLAAFKDDYAQILGVPKDDFGLAEKIINTAALMSLFHDHYQIGRLLENLEKGTGLDPVGLNDEQLSESIKSGSIDPLKLRKKDLVRIHRFNRRAEVGEYGLTPFLEEKYKKRLEDMEKDESLIFSPEKVSTVLRRQLRLAFEYGYAGDTIDMVYPPKYSFWRRYLLKNFLQRPIFSTDIEGNKRAIDKLLAGGNYNNNKILHTDLGRMVTELIIFSSLVENGRYLKDERLLPLFEKIISIDLAEYKYLGERILEKDTDLIKEIQNELIDELFEKLHRKRIRDIIYQKSPLVMATKDGGVSSDEIYDRYVSIDEGIEQEAGIIRENLAGKRLAVDSSVSIEAAKESYYQVLDYFKKRMWEKFQLGEASDEKPWTPYSTYYSMAGFEQMRRL